MPRKDTATITATGILNTDTASSATTFPEGDTPASTQRGLLPNISNLSISSLVPTLPEHIQTKLKKQSSSSTTAQTSLNEDGGDQNKTSATSSSSSSSSGNTLPPASESVVNVSFDMDPVAAPIANLLRRLMITEVPTMAFDRVLIDENDTPVYDEMLCQRLGMIPIQVDPSQFEYVTSDTVTTTSTGTSTTTTSNTGNQNQNQTSSAKITPAMAAASLSSGREQTTNIYSSSRHVLRFDLDVAVPLDSPPHTCISVYASDLTWVPLPGQEHLNARLVHPELLLAKIGCGQRLKLQAFALKGLGVIHAKWSPVSACYYEMKTQVRIIKPVIGEKARQLVELAPAVFSLEPVSSSNNNNSDDAALSKNNNNNNVQVTVRKQIAFQDCSRLFQDGVDFSDYVVIEKIKDSVRFTFETLGHYQDPTAVVGVALGEFQKRLSYLKKCIKTTKIENAERFEKVAEGTE